MVYSCRPSGRGRNNSIPWDQTGARSGSVEWFGVSASARARAKRPSRGWRSVWGGRAKGNLCGATLAHQTCSEPAMARNRLLHPQVARGKPLTEREKSSSDAG